MNTPCRSSFRALRSISNHSQVRTLHMTGAATSPSRALKGNEVGVNHDLAGHRKESKKNNLPEAGISSQLDPQVLTTASAPISRQFNTSRGQKHPGDNSTIDFTFMPMAHFTSSIETSLRVPLLPSNFFPARTGAHADLSQDYTSVHKAEIVTASADSTHISTPSAMSEMQDNIATSVDFHEIADTISRVIQDVGVASQQQVAQSSSMMKQLYNDLVDDVFGGNKRSIA